MCDFCLADHVFKVDVRALPSEELVNEMAAYVLESKGTFVIHSEEMNPNIPLPPVPLLFQVFHVLMQHKDTVKERLLGTCIRVQSLDERMRGLIRFALSVYKPTKPFLVTDDKAEAAEFVRAHLPSATLPQSEGM